MSLRPGCIRLGDVPGEDFVPTLGTKLAFLVLVPRVTRLILADSLVLPTTRIQSVALVTFSM